jgi:hypothetical protein
MNCRLGLILILIMGLCALAQPALAHDESIPCSMDVTIGRSKATVELRFPIADMVANDRNFIAATLPSGVAGLPPVNFGELDNLAVAKEHTQQMLDGLHIRYDNTILAPKLLTVTVKDMVAGVSEEDVIPRPMGVYQMEFAADHPIPPPKVFGLDHKLVKQPDDGSVITVMMMVSYRQDDQTKSRFDVVDNESNWNVNCVWTDASPAAATQGGSAAKAGASPATQPMTPIASDARAVPAENSPDSSRGYIYVALAFALALVGVVAVLFKRRAE